MRMYVCIYIYIYIYNFRLDWMMKKIFSPSILGMVEKMFYRLEYLGENIDSILIIIVSSSASIGVERRSICCT